MKIIVRDRSQVVSQNALVMQLAFFFIVMAPGGAVWRWAAR
jgi:hypothetical protein